MLIAIISDTHDDIFNTTKCLDQLKQKGIKDILHLGDFSAPFMIDLFKDFNVKAVLGNNDADVFRIMTKIKNMNFQLSDQLLEVDFEDYKLAMYHGTSLEIVDALINCNKYKVVLHGHTHKGGNS